MSLRRVAALGGALLLAGCGLSPWALRPKATGVHAEGTERAPEYLYYTDLGPAEIDVSRYPEEQKRNYALFARECGRCHTLARAVNSTTQSRLYWRFHLARMNVHSRLEHDRPLSKAERETVLDFLEYDSRVRKVEDKAAFEARTAELKARFDPILQQYLWELYQGQGRVSEPDRDIR